MLGQPFPLRTPSAVSPVSRQDAGPHVAVLLFPAKRVWLLGGLPLPFLMPSPPPPTVSLSGSRISWLMSASLWAIAAQGTSWESLR